MEPITLEQMQGIKLMNRVDTKYLMALCDLPLLLQRAKELYYVQDIDGNRAPTYDTLYYDTPGCDMYMRHHDRQLRRQKIRTRNYVESHLWFLEVKNKTNTGRTKKKRVSISEEAFGDVTLDSDGMEFLEIRSHYDPLTLTPHVRTHFNRITLVNKAKTERLTLDFNLLFENLRTGITVECPNLLIVELKQDGAAHSDMKDILLDMRVKQIKCSKYCVGTALTNPNIKSNRFKKKIRIIEKLQHDHQRQRSNSAAV